MKRFALVLALVACGSKPAPVTTLTLPGDGADHTAKPPPAPVDSGPKDPWIGRTDLVPAPPLRAPIALDLPEITSFKLKNGLQVYAIHSDRLPVTSFQIAVKAGRRSEPHARLGVSELTADMLVRGTKQHDAASFAKAIESVGGTIAADSTFEATLLSCSVLARDAKTCLTLVPEMLVSPTFPEADLAETRNQMVATVRARLEDASGLAAAHTQNLLWGADHVRGWVMTDGSVASLTREDVVAWHKTWFVPGNTMLVVSGAFDAKALPATLERAFSAWKSAPVPPVPQYQEPGLSGSRIRLVDKPGQSQTFIRVAQFGIAHDDSQFFDALVWNYALGGAPDSRLAKAMHVDAKGKQRGGPAYAATTSFDRNADRGTFLAQTIARNGEAIATATQLVDEIAKMAKSGPTAAEVSTAIANVAGSYGLRFQSAADIGAALITAELHGYGKEYLANYPTAVGQVTAKSAASSAARVLTPSSYVMVLVGDAKDLEPQMKAAGWRYQLVSSGEALGPTASNQTPPKPTAAPTYTPAQVAAAHTLVDAALVAKGGKAKLEALTAFRMVASGTTTMGSQVVPVVIDRLYVVPDKLRIDATLGGKVKVIVAVVGNSGWQLAPDEQGQQMALTDVGGPNMVSVDFERWRDPELILLHAADPKAVIGTGPDVDLGGRKHSVLKLRAPYGAIDVSIYIDQKTKLITKMSYAEGAADETDEFSDYKLVDGIQVAHQRHSVGGGRDTTLVLKTVDLKAPVDMQLFAKPPAP